MTLPTLVKDLLRSDFTIPFGTDRNGNAIRATIDSQNLKAADAMLQQLQGVSDEVTLELPDVAALFRPLITHVTVTHPKTEKPVRYKVSPLSRSEVTKLCRNAGAIALAESLTQAMLLLGVVTAEPQADRVPDPTESSEST